MFVSHKVVAGSCLIFPLSTVSSGRTLPLKNDIFQCVFTWVHDNKRGRAMETRKYGPEIEVKESRIFFIPILVIKKS